MSDSVSSSEWPQGVDLQGAMRALSRTVDPRDRRRGQCFRMKLNRVETIGVQYIELERMAGTAILGLLANIVSARLLPSVDPPPHASM